MIAITALLAIVFPKVGPIEVEEKYALPLGEVLIPKWSLSAVSTLVTPVGGSFLVEIWKPAPPMLESLIFWTSALGAPAAFSTLPISPVVGCATKAALTRVPDL